MQIERRLLASRSDVFGSAGLLRSSSFASVLRVESVCFVPSDRDLDHQRSTMKYLLVALPHVVIVGGGFGGLYAARALRSRPDPPHHRRSPQPSRLPAAALPGGDGGALAGRHRVSDSLDSAAAVERRGAAGRRARPSIQARQRLILADGELVLRLPDRGERSDARLLRPRRVAARSRQGSRRSRTHSTSAAACCSRSSAPSARPIRFGASTLLTFVVIGGGPTGVEMAGALAEISRQSLARDFRHFDPSSARIMLLEAGPLGAEHVSRAAARGRARRSRAARRRRADRRRGDQRHAWTRRGRRARVIRRRDRHLGGRRRGIAAWRDARRAARSRRPRPASSRT